MPMLGYIVWHVLTSILQIKFDSCERAFAFLDDAKQMLGVQH